MLQKEMKILKIDQNNNLVYFTQEKYGIHKSGVYEFLSKIDRIPSELSKLFENVFPDWKKGILDVIKGISNKLISKNKNYLINELKTMRTLTNYQNKKISLEFLFIENNLEELSSVLIKSFYNIDKVYKIRKFSTFLDKFEQFELPHSMFSAFVGKKS